jgi:propionyl-CoA carboxylase alpha chain
MREALNGLSSAASARNIPFQAALLAHPKFVAGDFNTGFIAEHYARASAPRTCRTTTRTSWWRWRAPTAARPRARRRHQRPAAGHDVTIGNQFVVVVKGQRGEHVQVPVTVEAERATVVPSLRAGPMPSTATGSSAVSAPEGMATAGVSPRRSSATACWLLGCTTTGCASTRR